MVRGDIYYTFLAGLQHYCFVIETSGVICENALCSAVLREVCFSAFQNMLQVVE
jgi:hypothetical protein